MSEIKEKNKLDFKLIIIIILGILCATMFIFRSNDNLNKEKKELDAKIAKYHHIEDSLLKETKTKINEYVILENKYKYDSIRLDSLKNKFDVAIINARQSEINANYYKGKYTDAKNKVIYLESHMINIKGDSLLISLSKKIN